MKNLITFRRSHQLQFIRRKTLNRALFQVALLCQLLCTLSNNLGSFVVQSHLRAVFKFFLVALVLILCFLQSYLLQFTSSFLLDPPNLHHLRSQNYPLLSYLSSIFRNSCFRLKKFILLTFSDLQLILPIARETYHSL